MYRELQPIPVHDPPFGRHAGEDTTSETISNLPAFPEASSALRENSSPVANISFSGSFEESRFGGYLFQVRVVPVQNADK